MTEIWNEHVAALQLSQLRVLDAVYNERSVNRAAERLRRTPSAISHSLKILRGAFSDELFVRRQDGMHPTVRAHDIAPRVRAALHMLDDALKIDSFQPSTSIRSFRVACPPYIKIAIGPSLAEELARMAPKVSICLSPMNIGFDAELENGKLDLAIVTESITPTGMPPAGLCRRLLFEDKLVFATRQNHPRGEASLTLQELARLRHITVRDDFANFAPPILATHGLTDRIAMTVPDTFTALSIVTRSEMISLCSENAARTYQSLYSLTLLPPPFDVPTMPYFMVWTQWQERDSSQKWLRDLILQQISQMHG